MGQAKRELVERCSKRYTSPKAYKMQQTQSMLKLQSEYQTAYKQWPWQPIRQSLKPEGNKTTRDRVKGQIEKKSTYGIDFVPIANPKKATPKKPKAELAGPTIDLDHSTTYKLEYIAKKPNQRAAGVNRSKDSENIIQPDQQYPFHGDSIYMASYPGYDNETMAGCQQRPIKTKDNIEIPPSSESEKNAQSTAMGDFVRHETYDRPTAIRPVENNQPSEEPVQGCTEYKDSFNLKQKDPHLCRKVRTEELPSRVITVSTAMSDFTWPQGFEPQKACYPPKSNHFISAKFDGTTTFNMAYKPWPVNPYELPIWARKPQYKRPSGGMIVNSLYMHDFTDPKMIHPPKPIRPKANQRNPIIKPTDKDKTSNCITTYITDFKPWEESCPPDSYRVLEVYTPPREKMDFETNQRAHFRGEYSDKRKPCRHVSQHRDLNENIVTPFLTTYNEDFTNPRPKSTPAGSTTNISVSAKSRCTSAAASIPIPKPSTEMMQANTTNSAETGCVKTTNNQGKTTNILRLQTPNTESRSNTPNTEARSSSQASRKTINTVKESIVGKLTNEE